MSENKKSIFSSIKHEPFELGMGRWLENPFTEITRLFSSFHIPSRVASHGEGNFSVSRRKRQFNECIGYVTFRVGPKVRGCFYFLVTFMSSRGLIAFGRGATLLPVYEFYLKEGVRDALFMSLLQPPNNISPYASCLPFFFLPSTFPLLSVIEN